MGLIVNTINRFGKFKTEVITSRIQNENNVNEVKLEQYRNAIKQLEVKDEVNKLELDIKYQNKLQRRSFLYNIISIIGTIGSIALTLCGITGSSFKDLLATSQNIAYSALIIFTQFSVWVVSANKHYIKEKFYNNYNKLRILQFFTITTSVICNYLFLVTFIKPESQLKKIFLAMMAVSVDLISLTFCSLSQDCKFRNYSYKFGKDMDDNAGIFSMLRFILTYKLKSKIKLKYLTELNEYNAKFANFKVEKKEPYALLKQPSTFSTNNTASLPQSSSKSSAYSTNLAPVKQIQPNEVKNKDSKPAKKSIQTENVDASSNTPISYEHDKKHQISDSKISSNISKTPTTNLSDDNNDIDINDSMESTQTKQKPKLASANILNFPNYKNQTLKEYGMYETVKERLSSLDDNTMLSASKLAINPAEWKKIKERLIREDLAYEQNSRLRKKGDDSEKNVKNS